MKECGSRKRKMHRRTFLGRWLWWRGIVVDVLAVAKVQHEKQVKGREKEIGNCALLGKQLVSNKVKIWCNEEAAVYRQQIGIDVVGVVVRVLGIEQLKELLEVKWLIQMKSLNAF